MSVSVLISISTANVSPAGRAWLSQCATENHACNYHGMGDGARIGTIGATRTGWFCYVGEDPDMPADLKLVFDYAKTLGCSYILFDSDAGVHFGLPIYIDDDGDSQDDDNPFDPESPEGRAVAEGRMNSDGSDTNSEFQVELRQYVEMTATVHVIAMDKGMAASMALEKARGGYVDVEWHQGDNVRFLDVVEVKIPE